LALIVEINKYHENVVSSHPNHFKFKSSVEDDENDYHIAYNELMQDQANYILISYLC